MPNFPSLFYTPLSEECHLDIFKCSIEGLEKVHQFIFKESELDWISLILNDIIYITGIC